MKYVSSLLTSSIILCWSLTVSLGSNDTELSCYTGYIMDTYCIIRGTLLDNPSVVSLQSPGEHSVHCLIDPTECIEGGYEILGAPDMSGGNYTRVAKFDDAGNEMVVALAKEMGSGCDGCQGSLVKGFQATVVGTIGSGDPPLFNVVAVYPNSTSCEDALTMASELDGAGSSSGNQTTGGNQQGGSMNSSSAKSFYSSRVSTFSIFLVALLFVCI